MRSTFRKRNAWLGRLDAAPFLHRDGIEYVEVELLKRPALTFGIDLLEREDMSFEQKCGFALMRLPEVSGTAESMARQVAFMHDRVGRFYRCLLRLHAFGRYMTPVFHKTRVGRDKRSYGSAKAAAYSRMLLDEAWDLGHFALASVDLGGASFLWRTDGLGHAYGGHARRLYYSLVNRVHSAWGIYRMRKRMEERAQMRYGGAVEAFRLHNSPTPVRVSTAPTVDEVLNAMRVVREMTIVKEEKDRWMRQLEEFLAGL